MVSPSSQILPPSSVRLLASIEPLLLMTPPCRRFMACAERMISPPGASTAFLFSTSAAIWLWVAVMPASVPFSVKFRLMASPDASATVPAWAMMTPSFRTSGASRAM